MADIAITWDPANARGDWAVLSNGSDLATGSPLESAVLLSLFTDKRAPTDYKFPAGDTDPRGWWGDTYELAELTDGDADAAEIGSLLWTLERAKKTSSSGLANRAKDTCTKALQWLIDEGVVASVAVSVAWLTPTALGIVVVLTEPNATVSTFKYQFAWTGI